jgi:chromosome segregation ATPase
METKPTIDTIVLMLSEMRSEISAFRTEANTKLDRLESQYQLVTRKIEVLNNELLDVKAELRHLRGQVESLLPTKIL